jgi:predicted nucleic acid-binding protein
MPYLVDTNILLRWAQPNHPQYALVRQALDILQKRGDAVYVTPQNLIEFWNSATRPLNRNGFGMTPAQVEQRLLSVEGYFRLAPDTDAIYPAWRHLVTTIGVSGVQVHDARLVAVMEVHGLTHILTFNTTDFARYPGIIAVHPQDLIPPSPTT